MSSLSSTWWRAAAVFLVCAIAQAGTIIGLNVVADPRGEFGTGLMQPLVVPPEAPVKLGHLRDAVAPETLVLGSSRAMKIAPVDVQNTTGQPAFNMALSRSSASDVLAAYQAATAVHGAPELIILGLEWEQLTVGRKGIGALEEPRPSVSEVVQQALRSYSMSYFLQSLTVFRYTLLGYPPAIGAIDPDGLLHYLDWEVGEIRAPPRDDPDLLADPFAHDDLRWSAPHATALSRLAKMAEENGTDVIVFVPPTYPSFREAAHGDPNYVALRTRGLEFLLGFCRAGFAVYDFEDVRSFGGDPMDFRDFVHYGPDNAAAVVAAFDGERDLCS